MNIPERIFYLLEKNNLTASDLGVYIGVKPSSINGWKNGSYPSSKYIQKIADFFNVSVSYLISGGNEIELGKTKKEVDILNTLTEENLEKVLSYAEFLLYKEKMIPKKELVAQVLKEETGIEFDNKKIPKEEEKVYIPMLGYIAAGQPIDLPDDYTFDDVVAMPCTKQAEQADFALQVKGDSMSPLIQDGETILVKRQDTAADGQIVVASINNATTLKKLYQFPDRIELHAINKKYEPIIINNEYSDFRILGVKL